MVVLLGPNDELWALTNGGSPAGLRPAPAFAPFLWRPFWIQAAVPRLARRLRLDLYHFTGDVAALGLDAPYVVTIHDLSILRMPETHPLYRRLGYRVLLGRSAHGGRRVITDSEASADDIVRLLGVPRERVDVVPLAADETFRPIADAERLTAVRRRYGLDAPFVLYVGNVEPRKNLPRLIEAFARVEIPDVTLALVGGLAWGTNSTTRRIHELGLDRRVRLLGYVPDEDLPSLFSAAELFAYPSLLEGFGLPVLEAMACGAPVLTSQTDALVEIADGAARLVDPYSVDAIAEGLAELLSQPRERARLAVAGLARARRYSWEATARLTLDAYHRALDEA
jgi:glycosyltransferase involved in cell wall biosynthesis